MRIDSFRWLTSALGLVLWFGVYGTPTKVDIPAADVAIVSLQNEIAAETDSTEGGGDEGGEEQGSQGSEDDGGGSSGGEEESGD